MATLTLRPVSEHLLRQVVLDIARLPEEDLPLVAEFLRFLDQNRRPADRGAISQRPTAEQIRLEARRQAVVLRNLPREQLAAQFMKTLDDIRADAIAQGTAID